MKEKKKEREKMKGISMSCFFGWMIGGFFMLSILLGLFVEIDGQQFTTSEIWSGGDSNNNFYSHFTFYTGADPTNGYVYYASQQEAFDWGYVNNNDPVYMGCDSWSISSGSGRGSVRIQSIESYSLPQEGGGGGGGYLFILDANHMPTGCGTWPAWWLVGPSWPNDGEIDIVEGVNTQSYDQTTLHTSDGCSVPAWTQGALFSGSWGTGTAGNPTTNCYVNAPNQYSNQGCAILGPQSSYGPGFNNAGGGVFALLWNATSIVSWYFPRGQVPADLSRNATFADPAAWGAMPYAFFDLSPSCPSSHFQQLQMVFDLTFCGDWAGADFANSCPGLGSCPSFVQYNPSAFQQAFWSINFVKIMKS